MPGKKKGAEVAADQYGTLHDYSMEEKEFIMAIEAHQRRLATKFLPWTEVLKVAKSLGYRRIDAAQP
jgi:hypothetical protein